jgi:hypothetical protein
MRIDPKYGWLLTKEEFAQAGYDDYDYHNGRHRGYIKVLKRACKGRKTEIIFRDLPDRMKSLLKQKLVFLSEEHQKAMIEAKIAGAEITEFAIEVTAKTLEVNAEYIEQEVKDYISKNFHQYLPYYIEHGTIIGKNAMAYARICALAKWIQLMVNKIASENPKQRDFNRRMRSFRANLITVIDSSITLEVKIPTNDIRFAQWMEMILLKLNRGDRVEEVIEIKRKGNQNCSKLNREQQLWIASLYINGNAMTIMDVYDRIFEAGRSKGWWRDEESGIYEPPTYGTIYNYIKANHNQFVLGRTDTSNFWNKIVCQASREYPKKINECWGIDGTAHNENVFYKGKVKQFLYAIKVYDYASCRLLHTSTTICMDESSEKVIDALKGAIKDVGYMPGVLQSDRGPGSEGLKRFCEEQGIKFLPAGHGRARAKVIEHLIGQFDESLKFEKGWSGQNRTASGANSHPSEEYYKKGKGSARSAEIASHDLRTRLSDNWNNHIIKELEGSPCNMTPMELWAEKESDTPMLSIIELAHLTGTKHTIALTPDGIEIQNKGHKYIYFPKIDTEEQREKANQVLARIPIGKKESSQVDIYILDYGKEAPVFHINKFIGIWTLKKKVPYLATFRRDTEEYNKMNALQKLQVKSATELIAGIKNDIKNDPDIELFETLATTSYVGRTRTTGKYDKAELNASEIMEKAGEQIPDPVASLEQEVNSEQNTNTKRLVDPDTGEIHFIPIKNL